VLGLYGPSLHQLLLSLNLCMHVTACHEFE
jgi:hypothetical protein